MQLTIYPRNNSDLLLQSDGSWERNWLPSSKSKMGRDSGVSRVTDGQRQKYFFTALQVNCCTLDLKHMVSDHQILIWSFTFHLPPLLKFSSLYSHPSRCKYSSFLFCLPLLWLSQSLKIQDRNHSVTLHPVLWR